MLFDSFSTFAVENSSFKIFFNSFSTAVSETPYFTRYFTVSNSLTHPVENKNTFLMLLNFL